MRSRCSSSIAAWTPPNCTKSCGSTIAQHLDPAVGLGRAAGGEAQRDARLGAVVDHDQIGAFRRSSPMPAKCCVKPRLSASAASLIRLGT